MYTCCPECRTWFRVTEAQLGAARAWVRCGQCLGSFDASTRLWSEADEGSPRVRWEMDRDPADATGMADAEPEAASEPAGEDVQDEPFESFSGPGLESQLEGKPFEPFSGLHLESSLEDDRKLPSVTLGDVDFDVDFESDPPGPTVGDVRRVSRDNYEARPGPDRIQEGRIAARRRRSREQAILNRIEGFGRPARPPLGLQFVHRAAAVARHAIRLVHGRRPGHDVPDARSRPRQVLHSDRMRDAETGRG